MITITFQLSGGVKKLNTKIDLKFFFVKLSKTIETNYSYLLILDNINLVYFV